MNRSIATQLLRYPFSGALLLLSGCGSLLPQEPAAPRVYTINETPNIKPALTKNVSNVLPVLVVNPLTASPGFDTRNIVYVRAPHQLEHFAQSEWVDTPARMLAPLLISAMEATGAFSSVETSSHMQVGLRLDTEVLRLEQDFGNGPSQIHLILRATLSDNLTGKVESMREFDELVDSQSEDPYGGVIATNRVVTLVLQQLSTYCANSSIAWQSPH